MGHLPTRGQTFWPMKLVTQKLGPCIALMIALRYFLVLQVKHWKLALSLAHQCPSMPFHVTGTLFGNASHMDLNLLAIYFAAAQGLETKCRPHSCAYSFHGIQESQAAFSLFMFRTLLLEKCPDNLTQTWHFGSLDIEGFCRSSVAVAWNDMEGYGGRTFMNETRGFNCVKLARRIYCSVIIDEMQGPCFFKRWDISTSQLASLVNPGGTQRKWRVKHRRIVVYSGQCGILYSIGLHPLFHRHSDKDTWGQGRNSH